MMKRKNQSLSKRNKKNRPLDEAFKISNKELKMNYMIWWNR